MRVAICISGQMRTYRDCVNDTLKNIVRPLSADVFIHTWSRVGMTTCLVGYLPHHLFACLPDVVHRDASDFIPGSTPSAFEMAFPTLYSYIEERTGADTLLSSANLKDLYGAKACIVEDYQASTITDGFDMSHLKMYFPSAYLNLIPMYYKVWACDELRREAEIQQGRKYDAVIRMRPDFLVKSPIPDHVLRTRPVGTLFNPALTVADCLFDAFAIGDADGMAFYSSIWKELPSYLDERTLPELPMVARSAERLLYYHLAKINAERNLIKLDPQPYRKLETLPFDVCIAMMQSDLLIAKKQFPDAEEWLMEARRHESGIQARDVLQQLS